jgi:spore germination cell wall hydrolase CwlJ-like protein
MKFPDQTRAIEEQDEDVLLAMLVWGEGRGEPPEGRSAIAHVPLTRKKKNGLSLRETILKHSRRGIYQFSCFAVNDPNRSKLLRPVECEGLGLWAACWRSAVEALTGQSANPAPGASHYVVRRLWSRPAAVPTKPLWYEHPCVTSGVTSFVAAIGGHVFARTA